MEAENKKGLVRVGRCRYPNGKIQYPSYDGFEPIIVMMRSHSEYYPLSPYFLKDHKGRIMENIWQFSKCYEIVPDVIQYRSKHDKTETWKHKEEIHLRNNLITNEYINWRSKGMFAKDPIRYPVGFDYRSNCKFALKQNDDDTLDFTRLDYITSRKEIYLPLYCKLAKQQHLFTFLQNKLINGENLLIIEVDGPHEESMDYYRNNYNVKDDFITKDTIEINEYNLNIMLNDSKHPFGHGYCLAGALVGFY